MDCKEMLYALAYEEHEIWINHIKSIVKLLKQSPIKEDKAIIDGDDYLDVTKYFNTNFEDWPDEYVEEIKQAIMGIYGILSEYGILERLSISKSLLVRKLCESEQDRRKSLLSFGDGSNYAEFSKQSYEEYWPDEMITKFDKLSLGLQYWDFVEVDIE